MRVTLKDGRRFIGKMVCTDREYNLLFNDCIELNFFSKDDVEKGKRMGMILVPTGTLLRLEMKQQQQQQQQEDTAENVVASSETEKKETAVETN